MYVSSREKIIKLNKCLLILKCQKLGCYRAQEVCRRSVSILQIRLPSRRTKSQFLGVTISLSSDNAESALRTKSLHGAVLVSPNRAVRAARWVPFPCFWGRRATGREHLFSSYWFLFSLPVAFIFLAWCLSRLRETAGFHKDFKMFQDALWECIKITTTSALFSKLFVLLFCSCFRESHFNKIPTALTVGVKLRHLLPAASV